VIKRIWQKVVFILLFIWCLLLVLVGARFAQHNPELISLNLLFWQLPPLSSGLLLTLSLLCGVFLGALMFLPLVLIARTRVRRLRAQLIKVQQKPPTSTSLVVNP
jgi:putative membrane protein